MIFNLAFVILLIAIVALVTYWLGQRKAHSKLQELSDALSSVNAELLKARVDFEGRYDEMRKSLDDTRAREAEAKSSAAESNARSAATAEELKVALEDKGRFQSEAARVDEVRATLVEREKQIEALHVQIAGIELEKTGAVKDAEAAELRATELIANERQSMSEVVRAKDEQIAKLNEFITQARQVLTTEFKALSSDALRDASTQLIQTADKIIAKHGEQTIGDVKLHHQQIQIMLRPVEETIKRLDKHVEDSNLSRTRAEALLDEQVKRLAGASESLTNALRKPVVRGSWGEMTLENALENAGLEPEIDFVLQHYTDAEDGRQRTDAIVNLPKGRKLIIDSKNLMESYIALANAKDEAQKLVLAENHSKALKAHLKALSAKEYWRRYEGLDCVIMFIPHDGMYHAAIQDEAELIREASDKRVFISNPMTLIPLLKAIRYVLDQERLNKSAEEISKVGAELYVEITRFATHMSAIGDRIRSTVKAYNEAIPGLERFILCKSRKLKQLGSAKGAEPEISEPIELEPRPFSSIELKRVDVTLAKDSDHEPVETGPANHSSRES